MAKHKERKQLRRELERMIEFMQDSSDAFELISIDMVIKFVDIDGVAQVLTNSILDKGMDT